MTFAENGVNLGLHRQFARLMRVVRSIFVAGSGHIGQGLERWPCQLAFGIWVASQMPNQVDRGVVFYQAKKRFVVSVERSIHLGLSGQFCQLMVEQEQ